MTSRQNIPNSKNPETRHTFTLALSSSQRAKLKGLAHSLKPVVQVGGQGFSPAIIAEISRALESHELIKIQLPGQTTSDTKDSLSEELLKALPKHAHMVGRIGRNVILFLEKPADDNPKFTLKNL